MDSRRSIFDNYQKGIVKKNRTRIQSKSQDILESYSSNNHIEGMKKKLVSSSFNPNESI